MPIPNPNPWKNVPYVGLIIDEVQTALDPAEAMQWSDMVLYDTIANRPAAEYEGRLFYATDQSVWYRDNGASWNATSAPPPNAEDVPIDDAGGYFTGADVEAALQELGADVTTALSELAGATRIPIDLRNGNGSNVYPAILALTDWNMWSWTFHNDVDGKLYGFAKIPYNVTVAQQKVRLVLAWNATSGVSRMKVATKKVADGESLNPSALVDITSQDVTSPGTAYLAKEVTFTQSGETWSPGDNVLVEIFHEGAHANDTQAQPTRLLGAYLEVA
jgi:hypothetical protein